MALVKTTKCEVPYNWDSGNFRGFDALSCFLSLSLKHSHAKRDAKNIADQNLERARACCVPFLIRHWITLWYIGPYDLRSRQHKLG